MLAVVLLAALILGWACTSGPSTNSTGGGGAASGEVADGVAAVGVGTEERDCITTQVLASVGVGDDVTSAGLVDLLANVETEVIDIAIDVCELATSAGITASGTDPSSGGAAGSGQPNPAADRDASLPPNLVEAPSQFDPDDTPPGSDEALDQLWALCGAGQPASCDALFHQATAGSQYEAFGFSCGGRQNVHCPTLLGDEVSGAGALATELTTDSGAPGDDTALDEWWRRCAQGSSSACAQLVLTAPAGSDYATFGRTCGVRTLGDCAGLLGGDGPPAALAGLSPDDPPPGDDPYLNALWDRCGMGSATACADLTAFGPADSGYVAFGVSCGWRAVTPCVRLFAELRAQAASD